MPFTLMSWNVQRLTKNSSQHKWDVVKQFVGNMNPDVLGLMEIGPDVKVDGFNNVGFVNTLKSSDDESQLCIAGYIRMGSPIEMLGARTLRAAETESQKRAQLKLNLRLGGLTYTIYLVHATASKGGGIDAMGAAASQLRINKKAVYVGDMNYDLRLDATMLDLQNDANVRVVQPAEAIGPVKKTHKKGGVLDFALGGVQANVQALVMAAYGNWKTIDHRPIAFVVH